MTRTFCYITGTRADFGLMQPTLQAIAEKDGLDVKVVVSGMHLSERFGHTVDEVRASGLTIAAEIPVPIDSDTEAGMALCAGSFANAFATHLSQNSYDGLLLLGDRWEMLAGAMAGMLSGIPVFHICGGERSGTVDDALRHAISKIAHVHLVATDDARERLVRMGEEDRRIHVVGTPGLVGIPNFRSPDRDAVAAEFGFDPSKPIAIMLFHPVVQDAAIAEEQCDAILNVLADREIQTVCLLPNADTGNSAIRSSILWHAARNDALRPVPHLARDGFWSLMAQSDLMIGNSSAGIIEAASFGIPVVNVGDRQKDRLRNTNVFDCEPAQSAVQAAVDEVLSRGRQPPGNVYGDGLTDTRIATLLAEFDFEDAALRRKSMWY